MSTLDELIKKLESCDFKVSTDTRKDLTGSVYFALSGENFDGNTFVHEALHKGAVAAVTSDTQNVGENIFVVDDVLKTLQAVARIYRKKFSIPILAIGGSNGKTTSKELIRDVLQTQYRVHATEGSLNNHIGIPFSILSMPRDTDIGVFEIGANHPHEHIDLLDILEPTHVVVANNGMDHLEGFGSPEGVRAANKEIYDWAKTHTAHAFVNEEDTDLMQDSEGLERTLYKTEQGKEYTTQLIGTYNQINIALALCIGDYFKVDKEKATQAIADYAPHSKRSQLLVKDDVTFIVDCYNANPSSMRLAVKSFMESPAQNKAVILGDMLELGTYAETEHEKVVKKIKEYMSLGKLQQAVFVGNNFKKVLGEQPENVLWFADSAQVREWFVKQDFTGYTVLLKGSRGVKVEKVFE